MVGVEPTPLLLQAPTCSTYISVSITSHTKI